MVKKGSLCKIYYGWFIVLGAFLALLISSIRVYSFGVFIEPLTQEFGWSRAPLTLGFSISLFVTSFFGIIAGRWSDKYGVRKLMAAGTVLIAAGFLLSSRIETIQHLYLSFLLVGIGASAVYIPVTTTVARWFDERRGLAVGISVTAIAISMASFPPILERFIHSLGWRTTFVIIGILSLAALSVSTLLMKRAPDNRWNNDGKGFKGKHYTLKEALHTKFFWIIYFMFMMAQFSAMTITVHIIPYAIDAGIPSFYAATVLTIIGIANIFGRIIGGWTSDKLGVIKGVSIFFVFQAAAIFMLPFAAGLSTMYAIVTLFGLAYGGWVMIYPVITSRLFGTKNSGAILGALGTVAGLGGAFGPYLAGYLYDVTGVYDLAFLISGVMTAAALGLSFLFIRVYKE
ncbi:MAG: MFS transporter [Thermoplasmata archaeon]